MREATPFITFTLRAHILSLNLRNGIIALSVKTATYGFIK